VGGLHVGRNGGTDRWTAVWIVPCKGGKEGRKDGLTDRKDEWMKG